MTNANLYTLLQAHFPTDRSAACLETPDSTGVDLRRHRCDFGALREPVARAGRGVRRSRRSAGGEIAAGAHSLSRVSARGRRLSAAQLCVSGSGAGLFPRRRRASNGGGAARVAAWTHGALRAARCRRAPHPRACTTTAPWSRRAARCPIASTPSSGGQVISPRCSTPRAPPASRRGAMLTHANLFSNAQVLHAAWGFREGDVLLHMLPIFHTHGLFVAVPHVAAQRLADGSSARGSTRPRRAGCCRGRRCSWACPLSTYACCGRPASGRGSARTPACSSPARRRCLNRPSRSSASGPVTRSSNVTA